jgi:hypothetical protein
VRNGYIDSFNNKSIQDGGGYGITAWMLNNITETCEWKTQERFFAILPDEFLYYMPSFSLSPAEASSYKYCFDSLIIGYYSLAAGTSLFNAFESWGVNVLPNPITAVYLNGTRGQNHAYASGVTVSLSAFGENDVVKIEYSFDQKNWNAYAKPFLVSQSKILFYRSTDSEGNTGPTASISLNVEPNNPTTPQPFPAELASAIIMLALTVLVCVTVLFYFKKRNHQAENDLVEKT